MANYTLTQADDRTELEEHQGGLLQVEAAGVFDGATLKFFVEQTPPSPLLPEAIEVTSFALTEAGIMSTPLLASGTRYYFIAENTGASTQIYITTR